MDIKIEQCKVEKAGVGSVKLSARLSCNRGGKSWIVHAHGQGESLAVAADNLLNDKKVKRWMSSQLKAALSTLPPEATGAPKEPKSSGKAAPEGQDSSSSRLTESENDQTQKLPTPTQSPTSTQPVPPIAKEVPKKRLKTASKTQGGTVLESLSSDQETNPPVTEF